VLLLLPIGIALPSAFLALNVLQTTNLLLLLLFITQALQLLLVEAQRYVLPSGAGYPSYTIKCPRSFDFGFICK